MEGMYRFEVGRFFLFFFNFIATVSSRAASYDVGW